jgi:hypothetical protein
VIKLIVTIIVGYHYCQLHTKFISRLSPHIDEIGILSVDFDVTDQQLSDFCVRQILAKKWEYNETVHQLFIDFKKVYDPVRREVLYNVLIELEVPMKLVRLIKMCLN